MSKQSYPYVAVALGMTLFLAVQYGKGVRDDGATLIPLLTLLLMSELAFIATAIGAYIGGRRLVAEGIGPGHALVTLACALLAAYFLVTGIKLWPG